MGSDMTVTYIAAQAGRIQLAAGLVCTHGRTHDNYSAFAGKFHHFLCGFFVTDKYHTDHVHHAGCTDYLRVDQAGKQNTLIFNICQNVAHHIAAASGIHFILKVFFTAKQFCVEQRLDLKHFHECVRADLVGILSH